MRKRLPVHDQIWNASFYFSLQSIPFDLFLSFKFQSVMKSCRSYVCLQLISGFMCNPTSHSYMSALPGRNTPPSGPKRKLLTWSFTCKTQWTLCIIFILYNILLHCVAVWWRVYPFDSERKKLVTQFKFAIQFNLTYFTVYLSAGSQTAGVSQFWFIVLTLQNEEKDAPKTQVSSGFIWFLFVAPNVLLLKVQNLSASQIFQRLVSSQITHYHFNVPASRWQNGLIENAVQGSHRALPLHVIFCLFILIR